MSFKEIIMCRLTTYEVCGKTTWKGCGKHVDSMKEKVPIDQWCDKDHSGERYAAIEKKRGSFDSFCKQASPLWQRRARRNAR